MATGFYLPDGRDFSSVFAAGNAGLNTGFKTANGTDIGNQFVAGNSGIATNYIPIGGGDLGSKLGGYRRTVNLITSPLVLNTKTSDAAQRTHTFTYNVGLNLVTSIYLNCTISFKGDSIVRLSTTASSYNVPLENTIDKFYSVNLSNASSIVLYIYRDHYLFHNTETNMRKWRTMQITINGLSVTGY